jgi:hypothetical protein
MARLKDFAPAINFETVREQADLARAKRLGLGVPAVMATLYPKRWN